MPRSLLHNVGWQPFKSVPVQSPPWCVYPELQLHTSSSAEHAEFAGQLASVEQPVSVPSASTEIKAQRKK